jgi:hypothetical protein
MEPQHVGLVAPEAYRFGLAGASVLKGPVVAEYDVLGVLPTTVTIRY